MLVAIIVGAAVLALGMIFSLNNATGGNQAGQYAFQVGSPLSSTPKAMTPLELLVSSNIQQRFTVLSKASTDYCSNIGNRPAIYADMANMAQDSYLQGSCCSLI